MAASVVASVALPISNNFSFAPSMDAYGKLSEYGKLGAWSPLSLFALGEQGAWYDPSDLSTMFQDAAGTTPVTADGQPVGRILDKSGRGNHATQATAASRPLYKTDGTYHWLQFDGIDDLLSTAAVNFTSTNKMGLWLGVTKNNSTGSYIVGITQSPPAYDGAFAHYSANGVNDQVYLRALSTAEYRTLIHDPVPVKRVLSDLFDSQTTVAQDQIITRQNGSVLFGAITASTTVPSMFANDQLFIASRGGVAAYFSGNIYSLIVRGALSTTQQITNTETWVNSKTGAY